MSEEIRKKYESLNDYLRNKYWEDFLNGREKEILQSFRQDIVEAYNLTEQEQRAIIFIDSITIDGKPLSLRKK